MKHGKMSGSGKVAGGSGLKAGGKAKGASNKKKGVVTPGAKAGKWQ